MSIYLPSGGAIVLGIFLYQLWKAIHTRNWGTFNKTSMIVWGVVILLVAVVFGGMLYMIHQT